MATTYDMDEGRLTVPDAWHDRTVNTLEYVRKDAVLRVIVTRHPLASRTLAATVDQIMVEMRRRYAGFEQVARDEVLLDAQPAVEIRLKFKDGPYALEQRSLWFPVGTQCVSLGVLTSAAATDEGDGVYTEIKSTLRRRPRDAESA